MQGNFEYVVRGCKDTLFHKMEVRGVIVATLNVPNDEAEFFGVYEIRRDRTEIWIADFLRYDDAVMFALEKGREEEK